ncbi:MAG: Clp protease N-terminal domain-containing protein [Fimbriimonadaceae bacterium]
MWQRFTERARKVVFYAQEEAQKFGEGYVSTEHLLLGLVRETDSAAARAIEQLGVSLDSIRTEVEKQLPRVDARPSRDMTLTPRAKRVIDLAYDESRNLNNNYIGTEHLLLGIIREGDGFAARVLFKLGIELEKARREIMAMQDRESGPDSGPRASRESPRRSHSLSEPNYNATAYFHIRQGRFVPEHLFLMLVSDEDGDAYRIARNVFGPHLNSVVSGIERSILTPGQAVPDPPAGEIMTRILAKAISLARQKHIDTVPLRFVLLALADEENSIVGGILQTNIEKLKKAVEDL